MWLLLEDFKWLRRTVLRHPHYTGFQYTGWISWKKWTDWSDGCSKWYCGHRRAETYSFHKYPHPRRKGTRISRCCRFHVRIHNLKKSAWSPAGQVCLVNGDQISWSRSGKSSILKRLQQHGRTRDGIKPVTPFWRAHIEMQTWNEITQQTELGVKWVHTPTHPNHTGHVCMRRTLVWCRCGWYLQG